MNTLRKSYSVGDVSNDTNPVQRRVRGGAVLQSLDENDRAPSRNAPASVHADDSDTEEFDDLCDEIGEEMEDELGE